MNIEDVFTIEELLDIILSNCTYLVKHNLYSTCKNLRKRDKRTICTNYYEPTYSRQSINYYKELHNKTHHFEKLVLFFYKKKDECHILDLTKLQINTLIIKGRDFPKIFFPKKVKYLNAIAYPHIIKNIQCERAKVSYENKHLIELCFDIMIKQIMTISSSYFFFKNKKLIKMNIGWTDVADIIYFINRNYAFEELAELEISDYFIYNNYKLSTELISKVVTKLIINNDLRGVPTPAVFIKTNNKLIELYYYKESSYYNFVTNSSTLTKFITKEETKNKIAAGFYPNDINLDINEEIKNKIVYYNKPEINSDIYSVCYDSQIVPKISPNIKIERLVSNLKIYETIKEQGGKIIKYCYRQNMKDPSTSVDYYIDYLVYSESKIHANFNNVGTLELDYRSLTICISKNNEIYLDNFDSNCFIRANILILSKSDICRLVDESKNILIIYKY